MKYQCLPVENVQNGGHHYPQLWRDKYAAVYEQRNAFRTFLGYEVIIVKRQGPCRVFGRLYPAKEIYLCSEDRGTLAVSISDLERALAVAQVLSEVAKQEVKDRRKKGACRARIGQGRLGKAQSGMGSTGQGQGRWTWTRPGGGLQMKVRGHLSGTKSGPGPGHSLLSQAREAVVRF